MDVEQEKAMRDQIMVIWSGLGKMNAGEVLAQAEMFSKDRDRLERLLDVGIEWLRDALVLRETDDERLLVYGQGSAIYREWGTRFSLQRMLLDMELLIASRGLLERRVSAQLVTENLFMKLGRA